MVDNTNNFGDTLNHMQRFLDNFTIRFAPIIITHPPGVEFI